MAEEKERLAAVRGYREHRFNWPEPIRSKERERFAKTWYIGRVFNANELWHANVERLAGFDWSYLTEEEEAAFRLTGKI